MEPLDFFIIMQVTQNKWPTRQDRCAISCLYIACFFSPCLYSNELQRAQTMAVTWSCLWCISVAILGQSKLKLSSYSQNSVFFFFLYDCSATHPDLCEAKGKVCVNPLKTLFPCTFLFFIQLCGECALFTVPIQSWLEWRIGGKPCQHEIKRFLGW